MLKLGEGTGIDYTPQLTQRLKNGQIHIHGVASKNIIILVNYFFKSVTFGGGGKGGGGGGGGAACTKHAAAQYTHVL